MKKLIIQNTKRIFLIFGIIDVLSIALNLHIPFELFQPTVFWLKLYGFSFRGGFLLFSFAMQIFILLSLLISSYLFLKHNKSAIKFYYYQLILRIFSSTYTLGFLMTINDLFFKTKSIMYICLFIAFIGELFRVYLSIKMQEPD